MAELTRAEYAALYGPTAGDQVAGLDHPTAIPATGAPEIESWAQTRTPPSCGPGIERADRLVPTDPGPMAGHSHG